MMLVDWLVLMMHWLVLMMLSIVFMSVLMCSVALVYEVDTTEGAVCIVAAVMEGDGRFIQSAGSTGLDIGNPIAAQHETLHIFIIQTTFVTMA